MVRYRAAYVANNYLLNSAASGLITVSSMLFRNLPTWESRNLDTYDLILNVHGLHEKRDVLSTHLGLLKLMLALSSSSLATVFFVYS